MENQKSFLQKLEQSTLFFTQFIESKSALLITIIITSLGSLIHIGYGFYVINKDMFVNLFGEYYLFGVLVSIISAIIFDLGIIVFSANIKGKTGALNMLFVSGAIVYFNYSCLQFHLTGKMSIGSWDMFTFLWSFVPVFLNGNCVFSFHKKGNEVVKNGPEETPESPEPKKEVKKESVFEEVKTEIVETKQGEMQLTKNISNTGKRKNENVQQELFKVA